MDKKEEEIFKEKEKKEENILDPGNEHTHLENEMNNEGNKPNESKKNM